MTRRQKLILIAPLAILGMFLFALIGGEVVKLLWNYLLPPLFGFRTITFWQALGILALSRILFGGVGPRGFGRRWRGRRQMEHWQSMTPEERERFRQSWRERCGGGGVAPSEPTPL